VEKCWNCAVSSDEAPKLDLRVLSTVQLLRDGSPVALGGPKQRGVLAMLVLGEGHPVTVSRLIDGIWGSESPDGARGVIHSYVAELRRALGPDWRVALRTVGEGYVLELPAHTADLERFLHLVEGARSKLAEGDLRAARRALAEAVAQSRGEPLSDVAELPFAGPAQVRLNELIMNAREQALEIDLVLGAAGDASAELGRLVVEQPYRERLWELLALARYRLGRQVEALEAVKQARHMLRDEVGIEPNPRLAQIEMAILRQQPTDEFLIIRPGDQRDAATPIVEDSRATSSPDGSAEPPQPVLRHGRRAIIIAVTLALIAGTILAAALTDRAGTPPSAAAGDIGVVDPESGELLSSVTLGRSIAGITAGEDDVFATDESGRVLVQIDPRRRAITRSFALDGEPWRPSIAGADAFVPIGAGQVARLDPRSGFVDQPLEPLGSNPGRVVVLGVGDRSWAVAMTGAVGVLNERGVAESVDELPVSLDRVASDGTRGWAVTDETLVELISFSSHEVLTSAPLRGVAADVTVGLSAVWIVTSEDNRLWRADPDTGEVIGTLTVPSTPTGVVTAEDTVWVSTASGQLLAIDPVGNRITRTVDFGRPIVALAYGHSLLWVGFA
jgi:DNA-binding SARP family transcriptional activator/streptogramin lyase